MSYKATNSIFDKVTIPDATDGTASRSFSIPKGAKTVAIHVPDLVGANTLKIQALQPRDNDQQAETWKDVSATVITGTSPTYCALSGIPENAVTTLPVAALGGGIFRFVASGAQTGAADALTIYLDWGLDG